jgi:signal transduction histidine kinase
LNLIIPVIFVTTALIQFGIFINLISLIKIYPHEKTLKYWAGALVTSASGVILIAVGSALMESLARGTFFLTLANAIYFSSTILLLFYCRSLSQPITKNYVVISLIIILIYTIFFEIVRHHNSFIGRQIYAASGQFFIYLAQVFELYRYKNKEKSKFISIFKITLIIELILLIIRIAILVSQDYGFIDSLNEVPIVPLSLLWGLLIINIWSYISIQGFWTERIASLNAMRQIENTKIKKLLDEKYKLINSLMTANKTALSGALSASIAHEINQPLGAIKINSQHLDLLIKSKKEKDLIKNIIKDNDRAAKIISTLKGIFTNKNSIYATINFDSFIESLKPIFIEAIKGKSISIKFKLNSNARVNINPDEISQALLNILLNSIEALSKTTKKNKIIEIQTQIIGEKLICSVIDNGPGVDKKSMHKIFDLYQSTKSEGNGIGLWLTKHIITKHKGNISLNKSYKKGAEFMIELPIIDHG